ncbi:DUF6515 family protein [Pseudomonas sp. H11T01]|uniref:DUF6515 family protein n=1 Tax=Pseudomonas sp. H11T01 TaxID=3402749 RepID=UPI003AC5926F
MRGENSRQFEHNGQNQGGQWQNRPQHDPNEQGRPMQQQPSNNRPVQQQPSNNLPVQQQPSNNRPVQQQPSNSLPMQQQPSNNRPVQQQPSNNLPIQSRPDTVRQTQEPQRGTYQDVPRRNDHDQHWQAGGAGSRQGDDGRRNDDHRWPGRPEGHGNGWGPGPQYRPGYVIDRFPDRNYRVPYRGQDYFYSGGYWYRPHGPRYVVVRPPRGIRVSYLPDYSQEVWIGGALLFLAAGAYYMYEESTQEYVVVDPPVASPQPVSNGYDVISYPANGQTPEQVNQDRYDCYRWAVEQSGFDPAAVTYQPAPAIVQAYHQAQGNCLSNRGYQVAY